MTQQRPCDVWASLFDARAAGETLDEARCAFLARHEQACDRCADEARAWERVGRTIEGVAVDPAAARRIAESALSRMEAARFAPPTRRRPVAMTLVLAGTFGAAAALAVVVIRPHRTHGPSSRPVVASQPPTVAAPAHPPVVPPTAAPASVQAGQTEVESAGARFALGRAPAAAPVHRSLAPHAAAPGASAADLLAEARAHRAAGRYGEAAAVYERVLQRFGGASEARMSLVLLGELELAQLGQPKEALALFDRYLATGDRQLSDEAAYGRVKALRALGDAAGEARAIRSLLASPSGRWRRALESRLHELER